MSTKTIKSRKQEPEKKAAASLNQIHSNVCGIDIGANAVFVCAPCEPPCRFCIRESFHAAGQGKKLQTQLLARIGLSGLMIFYLSTRACVSRSQALSHSARAL